MGLLERASALDELERWLVETGGDHGRLVLVEGESGVGKTSLLNGVAARHRAVPLLWSGCGSCRGEEVSSAHPLRLLLGDLANVPTVRRLPLRPLSLDAVTAMAGESGIDPEHLHAITGGNPFYITEVIAAEGKEIPATVL